MAPGGLQVLLIEISTNDWGGIGATPGWSSASAFGTAYGTLVDKFHAIFPLAQVVCCGAWNRTGEASNNSAPTPFSLVDLRNQVQSVVSSRTSFCSYLDLSQPFGGVAAPTIANGNFNGDGVHPNNSGHLQGNLLVAAKLAALFPGAV